MGFMNFNNMDYSFFDLYVDDYEYEEVAKTLTVNCKYRGEENKKIAFFSTSGWQLSPARFLCEGAYSIFNLCIDFCFL